MVPAPDILYILNRRKLINFTSKSRFESPYDEIIFTGKLTIQFPRLVLNLSSVYSHAVLDGICSKYIIGIGYWYFQISQPVTAFIVPIISAFVLLSINSIWSPGFVK